MKRCIRIGLEHSGFTRGGYPVFMEVVGGRLLQSTNSGPQVGCYLDKVPSVGRVDIFGSSLPGAGHDQSVENKSATDAELTEETAG